MKDIEQPVDMSILVADDDQALSERLAIALRKRGFEPVVTQSAAEATRIVAENPPAYAVCDLRLEDGNGLDIVEALRQSRPGARPIILTGYGDTPTAVAAIKLGAFDYLAKPATADEIVAVLLADEDGAQILPDEVTDPDEARLDQIMRVMAETEDNISAAARRLGMHRRTLQRILQRSRER